MASSPSPSPSPSDIIAHITATHQREMSLYLRHHASLPATHPDVFSSHLTLADLTPSGMTIVASGSRTRYPVPFSPPLESLAETRARLVLMADQARSALGLPLPPPPTTTNDANVVQVTEFPALAPFNKFAIGTILFYAASVAAVPWMVPGTVLASALDVAWGFAGGMEGYRWLVLAIAWPVLAMHVTEAVVFHFTRMQRHGVPTGSRLWWMWQADVFAEGVAAFKRFSAMVRELEEEEERKKY